MNQIETGLRPVQETQSILIRDNAGRIKWAKLEEQLRTQLIRDLATEFANKNGKLSHVVLVDAKERNLAEAIYHYYPGKYTQLKQELGLGIKSGTPHDHNKRVVSEIDDVPRDKHGKIWWTILAKDPAKVKRVMEEFAARIVENGSGLTHKELQSINLTGFEVAVNTYYEGGMHALKQEIGLFYQVRRNYWKNPANIEDEARKLLEAGYNDLNLSAIRKVNGSFVKAAGKYYPGGVRQLRENLGIVSPHNSPTHWTAELIEAKTLEFISQGNFPSKVEMQKKGFSGLSAAIRKKYPGGWDAIKEKLKFSTELNYISQNQANGQLRGLLEGVIENE